MPSSKFPLPGFFCPDFDPSFYPDPEKFSRNAHKDTTGEATANARE
jgi:hypothetical protein